MVYTMICCNVDQTFTGLIFSTLRAAVFRKVPCTLVLMAAVLFFFFLEAWGENCGCSHYTKKKAPVFSFFSYKYFFKCCSQDVFVSCNDECFHVQHLRRNCLAVVRVSVTYCRSKSCICGNMLCLPRKAHLCAFVFFFRAPSIVAHIFRQPETSDQLLIFSFRLQSQPLSI